MRRIGSKGMTLLEMLIVLAIMAVLVGIASWANGMVKSARVAAATHELLADIQTARARALSQGGSGYGIRFESDSSYTLFSFKDCNDNNFYDANGCSGGAREETAAAIKKVPLSVRLKRTTPTTSMNNDVVVFDNYGLPRRPNGGFGVITILIKKDTDQEDMKCISISTTRVREGVWGWNKKEGKNSCLHA